MKFGATILFIGFWIILVSILMTSDNDADLTNLDKNTANQSEKSFGHPLWNE